MKKISKKTKKKRISKIINLIIIILCVIVLCLAGYKLIDRYVDYKKQTGTLEDVKEEVMSDDDEEDEDEDEYDYGDFDYDALLAINSDAIGWITMRGDSSEDLDNPIDYPIVQYSDNDYYLRRSIDGTYSVFGTIFADYRMSMDDNFCILWGHNITNPDDMMFGYLNYYDDAEFYEKYSYYDVWIGYDHYTYKVFACGEVEVDGFFFTYSFTDSYTYMDWLQDCLNELTVYGVTIGDFSEDSYVLACVACVYPRDYSKRYVLLMYRMDE